MQNSMAVAKVLLLVVVVLLLSSCATGSSYKVESVKRSLVEIAVSPDRIVMECEKLELDDGGVVYGFMFHVLDEENTVLTLIQSTRFGKNYCFKRMARLEKIFSKSKIIHMVGIGDIIEPREEGKYKTHFPQHGTFVENNRVLGFQYLKTDSGLCFDAHDEEDPPCPRSWSAP